MSILIDELDRTKIQLEEEKNEHAEAITSLKQQLSKLEEYSDLQTDQSLKLEEEKAKAEGVMAMLQQQLENEMKSHEIQTSALQQKLETLEKSHANLEVESEARLKDMQVELLNVQRKAEEFKEKSELLEVQLMDMQRALQEQPQVNASKHAPQQNEQLQKDIVTYKTEMNATENEMQAEIVGLQMQLSALEKELTDQSEVYTNEISRIKEDMEKERELNSERNATQLAEMHSSLLKEMEESKDKYELKLEAVIKELKASELREKFLQDKLVESGVQQYEKLVTMVADLTESEAKWQRQVSDLEQSQSQYLSEISQLKSDVQKYQDELSLLRMNETRYNDKISSLQNELSRKANFEEDVDFIPAPIVRSPNHSPYKSDPEAQGKLIIQMKSRLEDLQRLLLKSSQSDSKPEVPNAELALVQELLTNNSALDAATKRMRRDFEAKNQELSQFLMRKDGELRYLLSEKNKEQKAVEALTTSNMHQLLGEMDAFSDSSNKSLDKYSAQIEAAAVMLKSISASVHDQDQRHISALESVLTDLNSSQSEISSYRDEVDRLRAQLDQTHHYDAGRPTTNNLPVQSIATETSPSPGGSRHRIDEGSGQLIDSSLEMDDVQSRENLLQQKDDEIRTLRDELDHTKRMGKRARSAYEELERDVDERIREVLRKTDELHQKESKIKELEHKLSEVVNEPVEAVVQYVERQPLENMNEAILTGMSHAVEDERLKVKEQEEQIKKVS